MTSSSIRCLFLLPMAVLLSGCASLMSGPRTDLAESLVLVEAIDRALAAAAEADAPRLAPEAWSEATRLQRAWRDALRDERADAAVSLAEKTLVAGRLAEVAADRARMLELRERARERIAILHDDLQRTRRR